MPNQTASHGSTVSLKLEVLDEDGEVVETSDPDEDLEIVVGEGQLPPSVEEALVGKELDQEFEVKTAEGEAFGDHSLESIVTVPLEDFPDDLELEKGQEIMVGIAADDGTEGEIDARIVEINDESVILDANHPLAGKAATFRIKIMSIAQAEDTAS
ncbi:MAG: FKBP-type peptidyl-prolyl cis-trans isomerase 2 [Planctomycetota bacterium]|jgi:FKBP-type peptidyl-prolyl cis-trans isomerase 2